MMNQLVNKRSLKEKVSKINWPELVFEAEAEREWFEDVTVITLQSEYLDRIYDEAWQQAEAIEGLDERAKTIMNSGRVHVREYIQIGEDFKVKVCIDRVEITDEVVEEVLDLLIEVGISPNARLEFGEKKTFTAEQIPNFKNS